MASFYGNTTDTNRIYFLFDKIFASRRDMDEACTAGTDGIFAGRFVLVKYDPEDSTFFSWDLIPGYKTENDPKIYADATFLEPYIYLGNTELTPVSSKRESDWQFYFKDSYGMLPVKSEDEYDAVSDNYYVLLEPNTDPPVYIRNNRVIRGLARTVLTILRDNLGNVIGYIGYIPSIEGNTSGNPIIHWDTIPSSTPLSGNYYINYMKDFAVYGNAPRFDIRGYDATVWEKIYQNGEGKFIKVANLNGMVPSLELIEDPPSIIPKAPYLDAISTNAHYRLHMPVNWGIRIKEAEIDELTDDYPLSDLSISLTYYTYNQNGEQTGTTTRTINAEIYFNEKGMHSESRNRDESNNNEILITPTGESGKVYYTAQGLTQEIDTYEIAIHLPVLGNLISDFFDIIYDTTRNRDIQWYNAEETLSILNGNNALNGKTRNLNTVAGLINTFLDRLGQIILPVESDLIDAPNMNFNSYDSNYIYEYQDDLNNYKYYRIDNTYTYKKVEEYEKVENMTEALFNEDRTAYYTKNGNNYQKVQSGDSFNSNETYYIRNIVYNVATPLTAEEYAKNNFYTDANGLHIANGAYASYNGLTLYKKNISTKEYEKINLTKYLPRTYYYLLNNQDYILDAGSVPNSYTELYYTITVDDDDDSSVKHFTAAYAANSFYTCDDDTHIYTLSPTSNAEAGRIYYSPNINDTELVTHNGILYKKNYFFYATKNGRTDYRLVANNELQIDIGVDTNSSGYSNDRFYFYVPKKSTGTYIIDSEGNLYFGFELDFDNKEYIENMIYVANYNNINKAYLLQNNLYIRYDKVSTEDYYTATSWYYINSWTPHDINDLFIPNYYYIKVNNNYLLANTYNGFDTDYYDLKGNNCITALLFPFYEGDKYYYYNSNTGLYVLDESAQMQDNTDYYLHVSLYVFHDSTNRWPVGYEWPKLAIYVPASVDLATRQTVKKSFKIEGINNGEASLNGALLKINKLINANNENTRDIDSIYGAINKIKDLLILINSEEVTPGRILYINDFGQILSSNITIALLLNLINNS